MTGRLRNDVSVMVAGQGGDGSLTLINLLGDLFGARGFNLYQSRDVASRIKGGHAAAFLRASMARRGGLPDRLDLLVAFDQEAIDHAAARLAEDAFVIFDSSDGGADTAGLAPGVVLVEIPFGRLAVRDLRRDLFKNSLAFGVVCRLLAIDDDEATQTLRRSLSKLAARLVDANIMAMERGFEHSDSALDGVVPWKLDSAPAQDRILISGNAAVALGFAAAGGRFFAGYPITPATEILDWLTDHLPALGGIALQAEDELAAINMAMGAAMTGVRSMTATSGPGIALMQEGISQLGSAEIGLVIVDCQRSGPSTGMPTKPEQSDIGMLVHGAPGDIPRLVLAPGGPADAYEIGATATNLATLFQGPVYIALDQMISQDSSTIDAIDPSNVEIESGKSVSEGDLVESDGYRRYAITADGISPLAVPGMVGGESLVTGNERDEWGRVSTRPDNRVRMVDKRARKVDTVLSALPGARFHGPGDASVGLVGFGMETGVMIEAAELLAAEGRAVDVCQVRTLWPVLDDLAAFVADHDRVYVVEHNHEGQYRFVMQGAGIDGARVRSITRYDGISFRPRELADRILTEEAITV